MARTKEQKRLQEKARRAAKKNGTYVDKRFKCNKETKVIDNVLVRPNKDMSPEQRDKFYTTDVYEQIEFWKGNWQYFIHHISRADYPDYDLACDCHDPEKPDSTMHRHYLRYVDYQERCQQISKNLRKKNIPLLGQAVKGRRGIRDTRIDLKCIGHFVNVVHYMRCRKSQSKQHRHYEFYSKIGDFPLCDGRSCDEYKSTLLDLLEIPHDQDSCDNCAKNMLAFKARYYRKLYAQKKMRNDRINMFFNKMCC